MKKRQYRSNQGRSPQKESDSMKLIMYPALAAAIASILILLIECIRLSW